MPSSHEQDRADLQRAIDTLPHGTTMRLQTREYPGPLVLGRSVVLEGNGSTIWATRGPVVSCKGDKVVLRDLRVEVTIEENGAVEDHCALRVEPGTDVTVQNVEVRGSVIGLPHEEGDWRYPHTLQLGSVPFGSEHDLIVRVWVPVPCEISSRISGLEVQPGRLEPGINEVTLHVERLAKDTLLSGTLYISTPQLKRSIVLNGHVSKTNSKKPRTRQTAEVIWQPADWEALIALPKPAYVAPLPPPPPLPPNPSDIGSTTPVAVAPSAPATPPEPLVKPSGPSIQWPPPPSVVLPPTPPLASNKAATPTPLLALAPTASRLSALVPKRKTLAILAAAIALVVLGIFAWWNLSGPKRISYGEVAFAQSLSGTDEMKAVAFSSDGSLVAGGGKDGVIRIWEASSGKLQHELPKTSDSSSVSEITSLAFSPDNKMLVSGKADANVVLWNPQTGERINILRGHSARVNAVAFSPNGQLVASGADDGILKLWDPAKPEATPQRLALDVPVKAIAFSVDGTMIAGAGGVENGRLRIWLVETKTPKGPDIVKDAVITSLAFSNNGKLAAGLATGTVVIWNADTQAQVNVLRDHKSQVNGVAFSPLGETLATASTDTRVLLYETDSYGTFKRELKENTGPVYAVSISSDGKLIASGGADRTIKLWTNK